MNRRLRTPFECPYLRQAEHVVQRQCFVYRVATDKLLNNQSKKMKREERAEGGGEEEGPRRVPFRTFDTRGTGAESQRACYKAARRNPRFCRGYAARRRARSCEVVPHGGGTWNERIGWGSWVAVDPACVCTCVVCRERRAGRTSAPRQAGIRILVIASLVYRLASRKRRYLWFSSVSLRPQLEGKKKKTPARLRSGAQMCRVHGR